MYVMKKCQNCDQEVKDNAAVCPNCGEYIRDNEGVDDSNGLLSDTSPEEEFLNGPGDINEADDHLPDDIDSNDELEKRELEADRKKFGKSKE